MILRFLQWFHDLLYGKPMEEVIEIPKEKTNKEKFLETVLFVEGLDPTPEDSIDDEIACSEVMSTLLKKVFPDFPILPSTRDLDLKLFSDKRFERILVPEKGAIVVSPRTATTYGHVGVFITDTKIMSNDSWTGKFIRNYNWSSWIKEFKTKRGLSIYLYRIIG